MISRLAQTRPNVVVSWFWTRRIPRAALDLAVHGGVNVHPSLLPRHRGADPYFWTLRCRDTHTGVTVHRIDEQYDTGPILLQRSVIVPPGADAWRLAKRLDLPSLEALRDTLRALRDGAALPATPQDPALATEAPSPTDDDCEIRWDLPADEVLALIRAASPEPGAFTAVGEESVVILDAEVAPRPVATLTHGECVRDRGAVFITCGDGRALRLLRARGDDEETARTGERLAALFPHAAEVPR
ncbi:MAG: formyltransferase family protein [Polyangiales bacterium]